MTNPANISRITLNGADETASQAGVGYGRMIIRVSADTRLSLHSNLLDVQFMLIPAGTFIVLDPPNLLMEEQLWFRLNAGGTGTVEVLRC